MINFIGVTRKNELETGISISSIDFSRYKWFWADFADASESEIAHLSDTFQFHPLAIEDCVHRLQRPKLDYYGDYAFYVVHTVREEEMELIAEEIDFFIGDHFIVSFHRQPSPEVSSVWERLEEGNNLKKWDPFYVFYSILDKIVDNYFPIMYKIEDELDEIEDNTKNKSMNTLMEELFDTRYVLIKLRHTVNPMRDLLYRMLNSHHLKGVRDRKEYFADIHDHLLKLSEMVMSTREITADIRDSYLSFNSHQTNNVMKVLTIITSIFAPLTLIAGIYGMNFDHMPELHWRFGYALSLVIMAVIGGAMALYFKRRGWFK